MLFHVAISVRVPHGTDPALLEELRAREQTRSAALQRDGKWLHLWRVAGKWANISIFKVQDPDELHAILESLPLYPFMDVEAVALCHHPGALAAAD